MWKAILNELISRRITLDMLILLNAFLLGLVAVKLGTPVPEHPIDGRLRTLPRELSVSLRFPTGEPRTGAGLQFHEVLTADDIRAVVLFDGKPIGEPIPLLGPGATGTIPPRTTDGVSISVSSDIKDLSESDWATSMQSYRGRLNIGWEQRSSRPVTIRIITQHVPSEALKDQLKDGRYSHSVTELWTALIDHRERFRGNRVTWHLDAEVLDRGGDAVGRLYPEVSTHGVLYPSIWLESTERGTSCRMFFHRSGEVTSFALESEPFGPAPGEGVTPSFLLANGAGSYAADIPERLYLETVVTIDPRKSNADGTRPRVTIDSWPVAGTDVAHFFPSPTGTAP